MLTYNHDHDIKNEEMDGDIYNEDTNDEDIDDEETNLCFNRYIKSVFEYDAW